MGGAASMSLDEDTDTILNANAHSISTNSASLVSSGIVSNINDDEMSNYIRSTHFTTDEIVALRAHYDIIARLNKHDNGEVNCNDFQTAMGFTCKESTYIDRMFQLFDGNHDGFISFMEFLQGASILSLKGTREEKIQFFFQILDFDQDGKLSRQELYEMLQTCLKEHHIIISTNYLDIIIQETFQQVDLDADGYISYKEFLLLGEKNPHMVEHLTFNVTNIIAQFLPITPTTAIPSIG